MITVEQREKTGLRTSGPLHATEGQCCNSVLKISEVEQKILHPQRAALANGGKLCRLQVCVAERRLVPPFMREHRHSAQRCGQLGAQNFQSAAHQNQIGVVSHEGRCGAEMYEWLGRWSRVAERVHVCHHIVTEPPLVVGDRREVDRVQRSTHLTDCRVGNVDAEPLLTFGQRQPEPAPQTVAVLRAPQLEHGRRRISLSERRRVVRVLRRHHWM